MSVEAVLSPAASAAETRVKVRFRDTESFRAAAAMEMPFLVTPVKNPKRRFVSVTLPPGTMPSALERGIERLSIYEREFGAEIVADRQYALERGRPRPDAFPLPLVAERPQAESLDDVLRVIKAPDAWSVSRGAGVVIAVVDTGINGARPEFPMQRRSGQWSPIGQDAWTDYEGHGTMCASIAAGTRTSGGAFDGVAPEAGIVSCRTHFYDSELATIYDYLGDYAEQHGVPVVATNSFGTGEGTPPAEDANSDFLPALSDAIRRGVHVFFSAGNYHELAGGVAGACAPTSIWLYKCRDDLMTVATARTDGSMWSYSSRGPGQLAGRPGMAEKPDVTAPTPPDGRVLYGNDVRSLPEGWGTSGACPQVAGLAALLLSKNRSLARADLFRAIRDTARPLGHALTCEGHGQIDCAAAIAAV